MSWTLGFVPLHRRRSAQLVFKVAPNHIYRNLTCVREPGVNFSTYFIPIRMEALAQKILVVGGNGFIGNNQTHGAEMTLT